ncbi:MAG: type II toxin-antitoxin system prevent-host-death family antitoxin [Terracidiphilus sp.]
METVSISVTEASRNFADCVNRVRYQGASFILHKGGVPVARIVPAVQRPSTGRDLADALREALEGVHVGEKEATVWLHDLEQARGSLPPQINPWHI